MQVPKVPISPAVSLDNPSFPMPQTCGAYERRSSPRSSCAGRRCGMAKSGIDDPSDSFTFRARTTLLVSPATFSESICDRTLAII